MENNKGLFRNSPTSIEISTPGGPAMFNLASPDPNLVDIYTIAAALSKICRFSGQCLCFYSVAEHSLMVAQRVKELGGDPRIGLLHDASEAYMGDLVKPLKNMLPNYRSIERRVQKTIWMAAGLYPVEPDQLEYTQQADIELLKKEAGLLMPSQGDQWDFKGIQDVSITIACEDPSTAARRFLSMADIWGVELTRKS